MNKQQSLTAKFTKQDGNSLTEIKLQLQLISTTFSLTRFEQNQK